MDEGEGKVEDFDPEFLEGVVDETNEEVVCYDEADEGDEEADVCMVVGIQSGPSVMSTL